MEKGLFTDSESLRMLGGFKSFASGFGAIAGGLINYDILSAGAALQGTTAGQIELQAQQQANQLRKNFLNSLGNLQYSAASRGIRSESSNIVQNMERSSEALGKDIYNLQTSAKFKADSIRTQQRIQEAQLEAQRDADIFGGLLNIGFGVTGLLL